MALPSFSKESQLVFSHLCVCISHKKYNIHCNSTFQHRAPEFIFQLPSSPEKTNKLLTQQHQNHRIPSQKHLTDKAILIHGPPLLSRRRPRRLSPHLLHILKHHIAMPIKRLDARQQLPIIAARYQDLRVRSHCRLQDREWPCCELVFFQLRDFVLPAEFHLFLVLLIFGGILWGGEVGHVR